MNKIVLKAFYFARHKRNPIRQHKLDRFIMNKPFNTWHKSRYWASLSTGDSTFEEFRAGFPTVVYNNYKSRIGQPQKKPRERNDLFHFCFGPYQPDEAIQYLRHPEFIENHFNVQLFQYQKDQSKTLKEKIQGAVKDVLTLNAFSDNPIFEEPSYYLDHHYNWDSKSQKLVRFKVPSRHFNSSYTVYIAYKSTNETELEKNINDDPDSFFLNRITDYVCSCQVGLRSLGSCVHVGKL